MRNRSAAPLSSTRTSSPTSNPFLAAVPASMATSRGPSGGRPAVRRNGPSGTHETPKVGGPPPPTSFPSASTNVALLVWRKPSARATPGTARTSSTMASGIRPGSDTSPRADAPFTRRSTPESVWVNTASNDCLTVSVST